MTSWSVYEESSPDSALSELAGEVARQRRASLTSSKSVRRSFQVSMDGLQLARKQDGGECRWSREDIPEYISSFSSPNVDPVSPSSKGSTEFGYNERNPLENTDYSKEAIVNTKDQITGWSPVSRPSPRPVAENTVSIDPENHLSENSGLFGRRPPPLVNLGSPGTGSRKSPTTSIGGTRLTKSVKGPRQVAPANGSDPWSTLSYSYARRPSEVSSPCSSLQLGQAGSCSPPSSVPSTPAPMTPLPPSAENRQWSQKRKLGGLPNRGIRQLTSEAAMSDDTDFGDVSDLDTLGFSEIVVTHSGRQPSIWPLEPLTQPQGEGSHSRILSSIAPSQNGNVSLDLPVEFRRKNFQETTSSSRRPGSPQPSRYLQALIEDDDQLPDWPSSPAKDSLVERFPLSDSLPGVTLELSGQRCSSLPSSSTRSEAKQVRTDYGCPGIGKNFSEQERLDWKESVYALPTPWKKPSVECKESQTQPRRRLSLSALVTPRYDRTESVTDQLNYRHSCTSITLHKAPKTVQHWMHHMDVFDVSLNTAPRPPQSNFAAPDKLSDTSASTTTHVTIKELTQTNIASDILLSTKKPVNAASANVPGEIEMQRSVKWTDSSRSTTGSEALKESPISPENNPEKPLKHKGCDSRGLVVLEGSLHDRKEQGSVRIEGMQGNILEDPFSRALSSCLDGRITNRSLNVMACGGFSDIWKAYLDGQPVAIKILRVLGFNGGMAKRNRKITKRIWREYFSWSRLSHPNIIQCLGFTYDFTTEASHQLPALVSPWMDHGTLLEYIEHYPEKNRVHLITGLTKGLKYLHSRESPIIHGDIRAANILISQDGTPRLTDFGLSRTLASEYKGLTTSTNAAGSLRWMAPELFGESKVTQETDVWAYAMTILEIVTGKPPFSDLLYQGEVYQAIFTGAPPKRPSNEEAPMLSDNLWRLCMRCWMQSPPKRPSMETLAAALLFTLDDQVKLE